MQQEQYNNIEQDSLNYSRGYDDGFQLGKLEGRREMLEEFKAILEKLKHDSERILKTD